MRGRLRFLILTSVFFLCSLAALPAQTTGARTPIRNGVLQTDLDAAGFSILNLNGGGGGGAVPVGATLYVDKTNGNNGTALRGRLDKPFLTITGAVGAASAGDVVLIGPGKFDESVVLPTGVAIQGRGIDVTTIGGVATPRRVVLGTNTIVADLTVDGSHGSNTLFHAPIGNLTGDAAAFTSAYVFRCKILGNTDGFYLEKAGATGLQVFDSIISTTYDTIYVGPLVTGTYEFYNCQFLITGGTGGDFEDRGINAIGGTTRFYGGKITITGSTVTAVAAACSGSGTRVELYNVRTDISSSGTALDLRQASSATLAVSNVTRRDGAALATSGTVTQLSRNASRDSNLSDLASASAARTNLGLAIGTNVEAWDADIDALAALSGTNTIYYRSAANTWTGVTIGSGLNFTAGTLTATGGGGTVTSFSSGNLSPLFTTSVATSTTTPALSFSLSTAAAHAFLGNNTGSTAAPAYVQPAFSDLSGSVAAAQLPNPSASTLGGIESIASVSHQWINTISTSGVPSATQPAESDLSFTDVTTSDVSTTKHGFAPKAPNDATRFLDGTGVYSVPAGGGTVTSFSSGDLSPLFTTSVATSTTTPALSFTRSLAAAHSFFGNNTGGTAAPAYFQLAFTDLSGSVAATQMPALTGDITTSAGAVATTLTTNIVTNAKAAQMAAHTYKGNNTTGTSNALDLTVAQLRADIGEDQRSPVADTAYTMLSTDYLITYTSISAARNVTLLGANTLNGGRKLWVVDASGSASNTNTISLVPNGLDTIDGSNTTQVVINQPYGGVILEANGSGGWLVRKLSMTGDVTASGFIGNALATTIKSGVTLTGHPTIEGITSTGASGTGLIVFNNAPTLIAPVLGAATATSWNGNTWATGTGTLSIAAGKTATVSNTMTFAGTDAQTYTFPATTATIARTDAAQTFTGHNTFEGVTPTGATGSGLMVFNNAPTLIAPVLGAATATSWNGNTWATGTGTLSIAAGKTATVSNTMTFAGTDAQTYTFPTTTATIARTDAAQTFVGVQTMASPTVTGTAALPIVTQTGKTTNYNSIATVSNGIPAEYATIDLTNLTGAVSTATLYTPPSNGFYRISAVLKITTTGTSPVAGPITITYTDGDGTVAQSVVMLLQSTTGTAVTTTVNNSTTTGTVNGSMVLYARSIVAIQYAIAVSGTFGAGVYSAHLKCEAL
jgi:hypothetical protein